MWPGLALKPSAEGSCDLFRRHLHEEVCGGDDALCAWVVQWLAAIVQAPKDLAGTALAIRGPQGSGKSLVGEIMGEILGPALHTKVSRPEELTGRFNAHHEGRLLMQVEEGFWAESKKAESALKHMITSSTVRIERKFADSFELRNYGRILITSNHHHVVPAGLGERRFAVIDMRGDRANDRAYFGALRRQMFEEGGCARLLHHLLHDVVVDHSLISRPPRTKALLTQQLESADPKARWLYDLLWDGALPGDSRGQGFVSKDALFFLFQRALKDAGRAREANKQALGSYLKERLSDLVKDARPGGGAGRRLRSYAFAPLAECRKRFAESLASVPDWPDASGWHADGDLAAAPADIQEIV